MSTRSQVMMPIQLMGSVQLRKIMMAVITIMALLVVHAAHAQIEGATPEPVYTAESTLGPATPNNAGFFAGLAIAFNVMTTWVVKAVLGNFAEVVKTAAISMSNATQPIAMALAGALALATLVWKTTVDMLQKKSPLGTVIEVLIYATITGALLTNYTKVVDQVWLLAAALMDSVSPDGASAIGTYVVTFWDALGRVFTQIGNEWSRVGIWDGTVMIIDTLGALFIMIGVIFVMIMSLADIIGIFVMGPVFFSIGVVFGPIMIATFVSDFTRGWFNRWLEFLIGSAMLTTVAAVVLVLISAIVKGSMDQIGIGGNSALMSMIGIAILSLSFSKLFQSVPSITDALFPGRTGASGSISSNMGAAALATAATGVAGAKMALDAAKATPGKVATAGGAVAGSVIAGLNAKTHLTSALNAAGSGLSTAAKVTSNGVKSFADQVQSSDAGKAVENIARTATQHASKAAANVTGANPADSNSTSVKRSGPGMSMGQIERTQGAFNSSTAQDDSKKSS